MFERFLCFCSESRIESVAFYLQDLHLDCCQGKGFFQGEPVTVAGGCTEDVLPEGVEGDGGKCPQAAQALHLGLPTSPGIFCIWDCD